MVFRQKQGLKLTFFSRCQLATKEKIKSPVRKVWSPKFEICKMLVNSYDVPATCITLCVIGVVHNPLATAACYFYFYLLRQLIKFGRLSIGNVGGRMYFNRKTI